MEKGFGALEALADDALLVSHDHAQGDVCLAGEILDFLCDLVGMPVLVEDDALRLESRKPRSEAGGQIPSPFGEERALVRGDDLVPIRQRAERSRAVVVDEAPGRDQQAVACPADPVAEIVVLERADTEALVENADLLEHRAAHGQTESDQHVRFCAFRRKTNTDSDAKRTVIPTENERPKWGFEKV